MCDLRWCVTCVTYLCLQAILPRRRFGDEVADVRCAGMSDNVHAFAPPANKLRQPSAAACGDCCGIAPPAIETPIASNTNQCGANEVGH